MNLTIASITLRGLFGRQRFLLLLPLPVLLVALAALAQSLGADPSDWGGPVIVGLGLAVVLPVMTLIIGTGVLGSEIDDGTIVHILTKPIARREIILAKLAVAVLVSAVVSGLALFATGLIAGSTKLAIGLLAGAALGSLAYSALFLALSLVTRRPVLVGLVYVLIWEGILGNAISGTKVLSIQKYVEAVADKIAGSDVLNGVVSLPLALIMAGVFTVGATLLAIDRLRSFSVAGETS
ncbi:ABC-2 type transport system permease protein [Allocatelliglobosispora scoriae]|uniref:ABC-2 type transport system permease protein n=1 Tax=Allocatelliglobosispora scoriae TaxID=643052 RepID=A0A841BX98_9ACTN|nr:ABC transporter permease [Allocatelliglobosispora scoriae]MBB5873767.1 ABC-2 type transport system permease protein [Allocatelliglobosispora scoriae]